MTDMPYDPSAAGLWDACNAVEASARGVLERSLSTCGDLARACYEAAVFAPAVPAQRQGELDMRVAALFLKKAVTELRSVWLLTVAGYTSPAACVAAGLWENALAVEAIAGNSAAATEIERSDGGELPWRPQQLAKLHGRRICNDLRSAGKAPADRDFEILWRQVYGAYTWLCQIKHPTLPSAHHDAFSATVNGREFVVMAAPDVREEDQASKVTILMIASSRVADAARTFAKECICDEASQEFAVLGRQFAEIESLTGKVIERERESKLPFSLAHTKWAREYHAIKSSADPNDAVT